MLLKMYYICTLPTLLRIILPAFGSLTNFVPAIPTQLLVFNRRIVIYTGLLTIFLNIHAKILINSLAIGGTYQSQAYQVTFIVTRLSVTLNLGISKYDPPSITGLIPSRRRPCFQRSSIRLEILIDPFKIICSLSFVIIFVIIVIVVYFLRPLVFFFFFFQVPNKIVKNFEE